MRHLLLKFAPALLLVSVNACSAVVDSEYQNPPLDGVIVQIERVKEQNAGILVAYSTDEEGKVWLVLSEETEILVKGKSVSRVGYDAIEVGQEVRAWTTGLWLYSYPPRTGAVRLVVTTL